MDEIHLELTKLRWRVGILQGLLAKSYVTFFSALADESPQASLARLLAELEATKEKQYTLLFASSSPVPEAERFLLADVFAELVEEMKTSITSMLAG